MTDEEYAIHILEEDHGWKEFRDKIFGRTPKEAPEIDYTP